MNEPTSAKNLKNTQIQIEQNFTDTAYKLVDDLKKHYRKQQRDFEKKGASGTHQARTERDVFAGYYGDEAARLEQIHDKLVFGKLWLNNSQVLHIGRIGLRAPDAQHQLLLDWRSKAAQPFYQATPLDNYKTFARRHISSVSKTVTDIDDEILDDSLPKSVAEQLCNNTANPDLVGTTALLSSLSVARTEKMTDIVSTIQREQDAIIRSKPRDIVLVQGGPGTGKTAVALHRGAYVLYEDRKRLKNNGVLIIGPSNTFLSYVDQVLPSLGETGVLSSTITDLLPDIKPEYTDSVENAYIKGELYWKDICVNAVNSLRRIPKTTQKIRVDNTDLYLYPDDVRRGINKAMNNYTSHNESREIFTSYIISKLVKQYEKDFGDHSENDWIFENIRLDPKVQRAVNLCWLPCDCKTVLHWLYKYPAFLRKCAPFLSAEQIDNLYHTSFSFSDNDIAILDYLDTLLGPVSKTNTVISETKTSKMDKVLSEDGLDLGKGIVSTDILSNHIEQNSYVTSKSISERAKIDKNWTFGHVIVDEAQELSPMQWLMLLRRCPSQSFTIVGDLDQSRTYKSDKKWTDILYPVFKTNITEKILTISYRTPKKIMDKAIQIMKALNQNVKYEVSCVRDIENCYSSSKISINNSNELLHELSHTIKNLSKQMDIEYGDGLGKLAVIVPKSTLESANFTLSEQLNQLLESQAKQRIVIVEASQTKGLEYDYVVLVDPDAIAKQSLGDLYVSLTRATKKLHIICSQESILPL